jgi:hypothetical protein
MGTGGPFPGTKARPGRDADHSPPSNAEVENGYELYIIFPQAPSWRVVGQIYYYYLQIFIFSFRWCRGETSAANRETSLDFIPNI